MYYEIKMKKKNNPVWILWGRCEEKPTEAYCLHELTLASYDQCKINSITSETIAYYEKEQRD